MEAAVEAVRDYDNYTITNVHNQAMFRIANDRSR